MEEGQEKKEPYYKGQIKRDFLYGLMVIIPIVATIWLVLFLIDIISGPLDFMFGSRLPVFITFLISLLLISVIGVTARNILGRSVLKFFESLMVRIPIISVIYKSTKQIVNAFSFNNKSLMSAVLIEYPRKGIWALAFVTKEEVNGLYDINGNDLGKDKCALFVPTTPNPTSGYFIYVNKKDTIPLALSIEESVKVLMSAGVVNPADSHILG